MPRYVYEGTDKSGGVQRGEFDTSNKEGVVEYLEKRNLIPLSIIEKGTERKKLSLSLALFERITPLDRIIIVRNMAATIKSGLSITESLDILIADADKNIVRNVLIQAKNNLLNGQPLSQTFASYPQFFPVVFTGMIRAAEVSGKMDTTLEQLSQQLTKEYNLVKKVRSALSYPVLLLTASFGVVFLLIAFVLPRLAKTFAQSGADLPLITRLLVSFSSFVANHLFFDAIVIAGIVWFFTRFRTTPTGRKIFLYLSLKTPIANELIKKVALVRFARTLGGLISTGTPILEALKLSGESVGNYAYRTAINESLKQVKTGVPFSQTFDKYPELFPKFLTSLITVGERTGTLEHILKTFADFYDEEVDNTLKDLTNILEPLLLLGMGVIIGTIALSILLPIYQLVGKFT